MYGWLVCSFARVIPVIGVAVNFIASFKLMKKKNLEKEVPRVLLRQKVQIMPLREVL